MPVTFTVASHPAKPFPGIAAARGLTPTQLLAEACPPQYENFGGVIRGTSFTNEREGNIKARKERMPRLRRLSRLFSRKKGDTASHSDIVISKATPATPTLGDVDIPTAQGFGNTVILDGRPAVEVVDIVPPLPPPSPPPDTQSTAPTTISDTDVAEDATLIKHVFPRPNGFVDTIISAYNQHHALVLRPDDIWIAILTQFNFFVNANAELLRANFVAHEGKKELKVTTAAFDDFGRLAREMVGLIEKNIVDPSLRAWALPDFSTTTVNDTTVSSILLMATLKAYFEYVYCDVCCGIPRVTLEGEKRDWEKILLRLEKLKEYGLETIAWYHLLEPVISRFVRAFDDPNGKSNVDFWQNVAHFEPGGSGPSYYSGWITAFCVFSDRGKWMGPRLNSGVVGSAVAPESLTARQFWSAYGGYAPGGLTLDGTRFHKIDCDNIPPSYAEVDVRLVSHNGESTQCSMTAGAVGIRVCSSEDPGLSPSGKDDTLRPAIGWWLFNKK
ncbi:hypothetical protein C8R47DRAFT_618166 [Mycena vitilis]|nr:hypothetical protein C8R47DRAFT_618166 [Mycena vitilis]